MAGERKKRQHTVPKTLLRGFVDTRSRLSMRRRDGTQTRTSLNDASVRANFYSYPDADGAWVDDVEDWLSTDIETPIAATLTKARRSDALTAAENVHLARFAASGLLRTATTRSYLQQVGEQIGPVLLLHQHLARREIDPATISPADWETLQTAAAAVWNQLGKPADSHQANLRVFLREFDRLSAFLTDWTWSVQTAAKPCLITADAPVAVLPSTNTGWHGILPTGSPVFIPISSRQLLIGEPHPLEFGDKLHPDLARLVNARLALEAADAVFADPTAPWPEMPALAPTPPTLPTPTITWSRTPKGTASTFPAVYPEIEDEAVRRLLDSLDAPDVVA